MQLYIRYNAPEGKQTKVAPDKFYSYLISGPHAEYYVSAFSGIISETKKPFVIDPHTYDLNEDKKSDSKYLNKLDLGLVPAKPDKKVQRQTIEKILDYQINRINEAIAEDALEDVTGDFKPVFLMAPYKIIEDDKDVSKALEVISISKELKPENKIYGVIMLTKETLLMPLAVKKIVEEFKKSNADGFCFSVDDFKAENESLDFLKRYRYLVEELGKSKKPIISLYGGFFDILLSKYGITGIVHGVDSGDKLVLGGAGGGRKQPARYYVYALKKRFFGAELDFIRSRAPELFKCECDSCKTANAGRDEALQHYLFCREKEVSENKSGADQLSQIKQSHQKYAKTLGAAINLDYLKSWADALTP